jgi:hypothetical protein
MTSITSNKGTCEPVPRNSVTANKITPREGRGVFWPRVRDEGVDEGVDRSLLNHCRFFPFIYHYILFLLAALAQFLGCVVLLWCVICFPIFGLLLSDDKVLPFLIHATQFLPSPF